MQIPPFLLRYATADKPVGSTLTDWSACLKVCTAKRSEACPTARHFINHDRSYGRASACAVATGSVPENPLPTHMQIPPFGREYTRRVNVFTQMGCTE
jgi:hypothetical protein